MTQHEKILKMCFDGQWHCQNEFRANFIFSPHKRREEIEKGRAKGVPYGKYVFVKRPCVHGVRGQFDYRMVTRGQIEKGLLLKVPKVLEQEKTDKLPL